MRQETTSQNVGGVAGMASQRGKPGHALPRERAGDAVFAPDLAPDQLEAEIVTLVGRLTSATCDLLVLIRRPRSPGNLGALWRAVLRGLACPPLRCRTGHRPQPGPGGPGDTLIPGARRGHGFW